MQMIFEKISGGQGGEDTLKMVYDELREDGLPGVEVISRKEPDDEDREYITAALEGVLTHRDEIDEIIEKTAKDWSLDRMSLVDLTILRLAVWEILYADDVPGSVSIAEAMELTERFSDPEDKRFVNGILGTVLREHEART
jgi:N utilization substance protein B